MEKKSKKQQNEQHFGSPNHELSFKLFFFCSNNWLSLQIDAM